jgi:nicotinate-nucleotide adenylyltransferase
MAALAVQFESRLLVSDLEMSAPGPSYTSATLDRLAGRGLDTRTLFLITGADAFHDIASWKDYPAILDRCHFVVVSRPDHGVAGLKAALPDLAGRTVNASHRPFAEPRIILVDAPTAAVSSTDIRRRVAEGASLDGLVPDAVAAHIRRHRLYQLGAPGELAT